MEPIVRFVDDEHAIATWDRYVILIWRGAPTRSRLEEQFETIQSHADAIGDRIGVVAVMEEGSPPPLPEDLAFIDRALQQRAHQIVAMGGAFEATEDNSEAVRDAAESLGASLGVCFPMRACFDVDEACAWLTRRMGDGHLEARRALAVAVETVRSAVDAAGT